MNIKQIQIIYWDLYNHFYIKLINSETLNERQKITNHIMTLAKQRLVLKKDERIKDPERHTGDTEADYKSNNRKA